MEKKLRSKINVLKFHSIPLPTGRGILIIQLFHLNKCGYDSQAITGHIFFFIKNETGQVIVADAAMETGYCI